MKPKRLTTLILRFKSGRYHVYTGPYDKNASIEEPWRLLFKWFRAAKSTRTYSLKWVNDDGSFGTRVYAKDDISSLSVDVEDIAA